MPYIVYHLASLTAIKLASQNHTQEDASDPEPRLILRREPTQVGFLLGQHRSKKAKLENTAAVVQQHRWLAT